MDSFRADTHDHCRRPARNPAGSLPMAMPLRVLLVEDSENDAVLLLRALRHGNYELTCERIDTARDMQAALARAAWDLVICDYSMPAFDVAAALQILHQRGIDIPFIIVSGAVGDEIAVGAMKAGAHDFVNKDNLARLVPAVERELREARIRQERREAEKALREQAAQMRSLSLRLSEVEEIERRNIHRELHDQIGANLSALKLDLALIESLLPAETRRAVGDRLQRAQQLMGETLVRMRNVMADLRPPALDDYGLAAALRMHTEAVAVRLAIPASIQVRDIEPRLPLAVETALFRITQEALNNVSKHARARRVDIAVEATDDRVILSIADDGLGFDVGRPRPQHTGWGLKTMRERALAIGAELRIDSAPGNGTRVTVEMNRDPA